MFQKYIVSLALLLTLTGCVTKLDVEQGNVISEDTLKQIHVGMSQDEVENILGTPILSNALDQKQLDYVYTYHAGNGDTTEKYLTLSFNHGHLNKIGGNRYSAFIRSAR